MASDSTNDLYAQLLTHKNDVGDDAFNQTMGLTGHTTCARCKTPIAHRESVDNFVHLDGNGIPIPMGRGCRSASYVGTAPYGHEHDLSLKKHWYATPVKE